MADKEKVYYKVCAVCRTFTKVSNPRKTSAICGKCGEIFVMACPNCKYSIVNPQENKYCYKCGTKYPWAK